VSRDLSFPTPRPEEAKQASAELAAFFRVDLAAARAGDEEPSYELLESYVDGNLSPDEAEELRLRVSAEPALREEVARLEELRAAMRLPARPSRSVRYGRLIGLAAALVLVAVGVDRTFRVAPTSIDVAYTAAGRPASDAPQPLFQDGFESGDVSNWKN
jgi:hypothetical protein